jgi:putative FmdB family regulatory protein
MPTYEYSCAGCGATFEVLRKVAERDQPIGCPSCGGESRRGLATPSLLMGGLSRTEPTWLPSPESKPLTPRTLPKPRPEPPRGAGKGSKRRS